MNASETVVKLLSHLSIDELRTRFEDSNSSDHMLIGSLNMSQFMLATQIDDELKDVNEVISFREGVIELFKQIETRGDGYVRWVDLSAFIMAMEVATPETPRGVTSGGISPHTAVGLPPCNYSPVGIVEVERVRVIRSITMLNYPINRIAVIYEGEEVVHLFLPPSPQVPLPPESRDHLKNTIRVNHDCGGLCTSNKSNTVGSDKTTSSTSGVSGLTIGVNESGELINEMDTGLTWSVPAQGTNTVGIRAPRGGSLLRHHTAYRAHVVLTLTKLDATEDLIAVASTQFYNKDTEGNSYISVWDLFSSVVNENERVKKVRNLKKRRQQEETKPGKNGAGLKLEVKDEESESMINGNASDPPPPQPRIAERIVITKGYPPTSLVWSRKSNLLFCGNDKDGMVTGWDLKAHTCKVAVKLHEAGITSLAELIREPSGDVIILSGSKDGCISVWDVAKGCAPPRPQSSAASKVTETARKRYLSKSLELEPEDGVIANVAAHECGVSCIAYASFPWFLLFTAGIYNVKESTSSDIRVFNVQQTTDDQILRPNMKCRHLKGHRGQITTLLVVVDEAQLVSTDSCGGILVWSLNNGISLAQSLNLHSPPLALTMNEVDSAAAVAAKQVKEQSANQKRPLSPLVGSMNSRPTSKLSQREETTADQDELNKSGHKGANSGENYTSISSRNVLISPENLTVKAASIREVPPVLGYTLAAFCPANNGVFTASVETVKPSPRRSSLAKIPSEDAEKQAVTSKLGSSSSSVTSSNANGTLNEDEVDLSGESNAIAKSKIKAGYALSNDEEGVGGGGLDMSCLVLGMRTRMLDALAFKSPSIGAPLIYCTFNPYYSSFVTASAKHLCTWDAATGKLTRCFSAQQICSDEDSSVIGLLDSSHGEITAAILEPLGRHLVVGDSQGKVTIIDYVTGAKIKSMDPHTTGAVVRLCYEFKCVVSFGGGCRPLQVCDDCDPNGYSAARSVKLRSLTFKGVVKSEHHAEEGLANGGVAATTGKTIDQNEEDEDESEESLEEMSSESEPEDMEDSLSESHLYQGTQDSDDYNSVGESSYSTAGESGTLATSSYSSYLSQSQQGTMHQSRLGGNGSVSSWIAIINAKLTASKMAKKMKRKLAIDMARKANDHDLAKALPEAVDGCVSPHMNMIALLSYGGGGKGGSGYHLQIWNYEMFNFIGTCVIPDRYIYKDNEFGSIYKETTFSRIPQSPKSPVRRGSNWDMLRNNGNFFLTAAPLLPETPQIPTNKKPTEKLPCLPTKVIFLDPYPILAAACDDRTVRLWSLPSLTFLATLTAPPPSKISRLSSSPPTPTSPLPSGVSSDRANNNGKIYGKDIDEFTSLLWVQGNEKLNEAVKQEKSKIEYLKTGMKNKADLKKAQSAVASNVRNFNCHHIFAGDSAGRIVNWQFNLNELEDLIKEETTQNRAKVADPHIGDEFSEQNLTMGNSLTSLVGPSFGHPVDAKRGPNFNPHRVASAEITLTALRSFNRSQFLAVDNHKREEMNFHSKTPSHRNSAASVTSQMSFKRNSGVDDDLGSKRGDNETLSEVSYYGALRRCSGQWVAHGTGLPPQVPPGSAPGTPPPPNPVISSLHWIPYKPSAFINQFGTYSRANSGNRRGGDNDTVFSFGHFNKLLNAGGGVLISSCNDGTARLWQFHQPDESVPPTPSLDPKTATSHTKLKVPPKSWRVPLCLGGLDSHCPEPAPQHGPQQTVSSKKPCAEEIPWLFDPHTVLETDKNRLDPQDPPPIRMGPNPSVMSEFTEYITPKRIPANFKRRKPTYLEERKEASLTDMSLLTSLEADNDSVSTSNSATIVSDSTLLSNAGSRADEAIGGGPKRGKVGAAAQMGHARNPHQKAQSSCIENLVKELKITTPSVLKMLSDQKAKQLQKEQEALASPSSLLSKRSGLTDFSEIDMDTYLSQKLSIQGGGDKDEFNWGGMFDSLTQFENDLAYWGESRPPNPYLNRAPRRRASPPDIHVEPFDKKKYLSSAGSTSKKSQGLGNSGRFPNSGRGAGGGAVKNSLSTVSSTVMTHGSLDKLSFGNSVINSASVGEGISMSENGRTASSGGANDNLRMSRSGKGEGKLQRMLDSSSVASNNQGRNVSDSDAVKKPNIYGNVGDVRSVHMRRLNKMRHMGY